MVRPLQLKEKIKTTFDISQQNTLENYKVKCKS